MRQPQDFTPYAWQIDVAGLLFRRQRLATVAAPGAGKTHAALLCCYGLRAALGPHIKALVIAPAGKVATQWADACGEWGLYAETVGLRGLGGAALADRLVTNMTAINDSRATILPWSRLSRAADADAILTAIENVQGAGKFHVLIVDESHYAQSAGESSIRTNAKGDRKRVRNRSGGALLGDLGRTGLRSCATYCLALTGTPATSDPKKMRAQLLLAGLDAKLPLIADKRSYESLYWGGRFEHNYAAGRKLWTCETEPTQEHDDLVKQAIYVVDMKQIIDQLPAHRRVMVNNWGDAADENTQAPQELQDWADAVTHTGKPKPLPSLEYLADIRREQTEARALAIAETVKSWHGEAAPGQLMLVWCAYQASAETVGCAIRKALGKQAGGQVLISHGSTTDRAEHMRRAVSGRCRVFVTTHAASGTGVDGLQHHACRQLVVEAPCTPGQAEQTEGRIVRTGQASPVLTEYVNAGIERTILQGIGIKAAAINHVLAPASGYERKTKDTASFFDETAWEDWEL